MKLYLNLKRVSNYFFITLIIFMIIMIGCSLPSNSGSSSNKSSSKETEEITMSGSFNIKVEPNIQAKNNLSVKKFSINTEEYIVTALDITVTYVSITSVVGIFNWTPVDGTKTYSVSIGQYGEYEIKVVQTAVNDDDPDDVITTEDSVAVDIQPMKVTIVTIVPGASLDIVVDDDGTTIPAPTIINFDPINGATNVDLNYWGLTVEFSEKMKNGVSVTNNSPHIENVLHWSDTNPSKFYYIFQEPLQPNTTYTFVLNPSDHPLSFQNLAGIPLAADTTYTFTTGSTTNQPSIVSSSIANGATDVEIDVDGITITFDQDMKTNSQSISTNFEIETIHNWLDSRRYRIDFNEVLENGKDYTITLNQTGSQQGFRNINNVRLSENTTIAFRTEYLLYSTHIESTDLVIHGVTVERIGNNIRFSVNYESTFSGGYSFFNPPEGDIFKYFNMTTGIYSGNNTFVIDIPVTEISQTDEITMLFMHEDNVGRWLFIYPAAFADLLY